MSKVGGSLKLIRSLSSGIKTLPALWTGLNPVIPVIVNWGLQVLFKIKSKLFFETYSTPSKREKSLTLSYPTILANFKDY